MRTLQVPVDRLRRRGGDDDGLLQQRLDFHPAPLRGGMHPPEVAHAVLALHQPALQQMPSAFVQAVLRLPGDIE